jgi:hypothetical protein
MDWFPRSALSVIFEIETDRAMNLHTYADAIASEREVINQVYPEPDNLVLAIIGDAELIREEIAKYGPITEVLITAPRFRP